jgi:CheY-like chemotaxis protein
MTRNQLTDDRLAAERRSSAPLSLILVVDPDPETCAMYVAGLALSGWAADGVADGREALAKAIRYRPAVVVTDAHAPGLDGVELCRLLKKDVDTQYIPIVVVTSDATETEVTRAREAGADDVLIKPCLPGELTRAIEATLATPLVQRESQSMRLRAASRFVSSRYGHTRSRRHLRGETTNPPLRPPELVCPQCDQPLAYLRSYIGGVNASRSEQWDDYECRDGCGPFQYRHRTRKLRERQS